MPSKRDPRTGLRSANSNWDFWTSLPEALHQVTVVMSDRGLPRSFRHMHGFGSHTFSFLNAQNERFWVKFTFKTQQGIQNLTDAEAEALVGKDRESSHRDLYDSIENKDFPPLDPVRADHAGKRGRHVSPEPPSICRKCGRTAIIR